MRDQLSDQLSDQLFDQLSGQLRGQLFDQLSDQLLGQLRGQLFDQLGDQLLGQLSGQLFDQLGDQKIWNPHFLWGSQDFYWIAWARFATKIGVKLKPDTARRLDIMERIYDAIENGVIDVSDPSLKDRIAELTATRDQAKGDSERALAHIVKIGPAITPESLRAFAAALRKKLRNGDGTFARDQVSPI